jgi:hypothetical protein
METTVLVSIIILPFLLFVFVLFYQKNRRKASYDLCNKISSKISKKEGGGILGGWKDPKIFFREQNLDGRRKALEAL